MSRRLDALFGRDHKVLVSYLCVGDPSVDESVELARACVRAGTDVLELGVPFSDPTADGPAIARASQRAIAAGGGIEATLRVAGAIRASDPQVGLVLFGYYNPIFIRGESRTVRDAAEAGVDALLVVDLPVGEAGPLLDEARIHDVGFVPLLTPTSRVERIAATAGVVRQAHVPFIYYVSVTGITGSGAIDAKEAGIRAAQVREQTKRPVVVGFGIDSSAKAHNAAQQADGVVVGTALVRAIEQGETSLDRRKAVEHLVRELRLAIDRI